MGTILKSDPRLLVKLSATSMAFSMAAAKLYAHQLEIMNEIKKDADYLEQLKLAYLESAESDEHFAELFTEVSAEVDDLLLELTDDYDRT